MLRPILTALLAATLLLACAPAPVTSGRTASPDPTVAPGVYTYQPSPLIWQLVTIVDGDVSHAAGAVFEWNCAGQSWTIGTIPASVAGGDLRFGDERFSIERGRLDARWQPGSDPRGLPRPVCPGPTPTTKTVLSTDAARELVKRAVTLVAPVLVPTALPDGMAATVDARPDGFAVEYLGSSGVRVTLRTAVMNPQPVAPGGAQWQLFFRGDLHAYYQALDGRPTTPRTLLWNEYATSMDKGTTFLSYALTADGITEAEFWRIAASLE